MIFIEPPHEWMDRITIKPQNYGLNRIISRLKEKGINDIKAYDFTFQSIKDFNINKLKIPKSDYYLFSVMETNYVPALHMARYLKQKYNSKIIFGGPAATELGEEILDFDVDYVLVGMAEKSLVDLFQGIPEKEIPNLISKNYKTKIKYPDWQDVKPIDFEWIANGKYKENHFFIMESLGCIGNCDFCTIKQKEPYFLERDFDYTIKEIKECINIAQKKNIKKIILQPIHQNYCHRILPLLKLLKENNLLQYIEGIAFNSRADTFLENKENIRESLNYGINIEVYIGVENFSEEIIKELNKGITRKQNIQSLIQLNNLKKFRNFNFKLSFIGLTPNTKIKHLKENIQVFKKIIEHYDYSYPYHFLFHNPIRFGKKGAEKYGKIRRKGTYLYNNFMKLDEEGNFGYPENKKLKDILKKYYSIYEQLPNFALRKSLSKEINIKDKKFIQAEIYIMEKLIKKEKVENFIKNINSIFQNALIKLQKDLK